MAVYGLNKSNPDENSQPNPFNHYGKSKLLAEEVIKKWYNSNREKKSITIVRPTVIFGERNRGNVFNLLNQISSGKFIMIGNGNNKKSMAYIGNVVEFIKFKLLNSEMGYDVFNYADKPDYNMNQLVERIEKKLNINILKFKLPYWLGMLGGYIFDILSKILFKNFTISSVRVKKFCATTQFDATKVHAIFDAPHNLNEGLDKTLEHEFINPKDDDILFFTE